MVEAVLHYIKVLVHFYTDMFAFAGYTVFLSNKVF